MPDDLEADNIRHDATFILKYLEEDLPLHITDEEEDLFPLLERRSLPDDGLDHMLAVLREEHEADEGYRRRLLEPLRSIAKGLMPSNRQVFVHEARTFGVLQRRHLAWENGTILPLARKRLNKHDLAELGRKMAARRGLSFPD